jgi:cephalosporin hydroxylase
MKYLNDVEAAHLAIGVYRAMQKAPELVKLHKYLTEKKYGTFIELGTCKGGMTWWFSHLPDFKKIVSVDIPGGSFGVAPAENDKEIIRNWVGQDHDVTLCTGDSQKEETVAEVKGEFEGGLVDCLFIDADHTYEGVKRDFELWSPLVRNGGAVILHDVADHSVSNPACRVKQFWDEYREAHPMGIYIQIAYASDPDWAGLGIIEV